MELITTCAHQPSNFPILNFLPPLRFPKYHLVILHRGDARQRIDGHTEWFQGITSAFEDLLDQRADANDLGTSCFGETRQTKNSLSAGEEVIDNQYFFTVS